MKQIALTIIALLAASAAWAQDDVYFVPTKKALEAERQEMYGHSSYDQIAIPTDKAFEHSNWADGRSAGGRNVDEYNRRGKARSKNDSLNTMIWDSTILGLTIGLGAAVSALIPISPSDGIADGGELLGA